MSLASPPDPSDAYRLEALRRFYAWHARIYDFTRPLLLLGRRRAIRALEAAPGHAVLDVGCGTGFSLPALVARGAQVTAVELSEHMREKAAGRLARAGLSGRVRFDPRPYGEHPDYAAALDRVLFSYSLSMIAPYERVLARARADLRPGGRIVVVDFLDALPGVAGALRGSHVFLGPGRLQELQRLFPKSRVELRSGPLWRYYVFAGEAG